MRGVSVPPSCGIDLPCRAQHDGSVPISRKEPATMSDSTEPMTESSAVVEYTIPPRISGPPLHVHPGMDETWFVLDGELTLHIGDGRTSLRSGHFVLTSGDVPHTFSNDTGAPVRFLLVCAGPRPERSPSLNASRSPTCARAMEATRRSAASILRSPQAGSSRSLAPTAPGKTDHAWRSWRASGPGAAGEVRVLGVDPSDGGSVVARPHRHRPAGVGPRAGT